jgi:hypothetical protein
VQMEPNGGDSFDASALKNNIYISIKASLPV